MSVILLLIEIHLFDSHSLKEKRSILKSLKEKINRKFNVSVSELDFHEKWQKTLIGMVMISGEKAANDRNVCQIERFLEDDRRFDILEIKTEQLI